MIESPQGPWYMRREWWVQVFWKLEEAVVSSALDMCTCVEPESFFFYCSHVQQYRIMIQAHMIRKKVPRGYKSNEGISFQT